MALIDGFPQAQLRGEGRSWPRVYCACVGTGELDELVVELRRFRDERDWSQYHDAKNLSMAVAGEAGELAAELQWTTPAEVRTLAPERRRRVAEEAADVLIYLLYLADALGVDLVEVARAKVSANAERFPLHEES